jgi:DedD protein
MILNRILKGWALLALSVLLGCSLLEESPKKSASMGLITTPPSYYSTPKARYLGGKYKEHLDGIVERIVRNPKTANLQFANNIASVGGIGFFTHAAAKTPDERYLEVILGVPETFETKADYSAKVHRLFSLYGTELLAILAGDRDIYQEKEVSGYGLNFSWRTITSDSSGPRVTVERAVVYFPKEKVRNFIQRQISQNSFLGEAIIFGVEEDGPMALVSYRAQEPKSDIRPPIREETLAVAKVEPQPEPKPLTSQPLPTTPIDVPDKRLESGEKEQLALNEEASPTLAQSRAPEKKEDVKAVAAVPEKPSRAQKQEAVHRGTASKPQTPRAEEEKSEAATVGAAAPSKSQGVTPLAAQDPAPLQPEKTLEQTAQITSAKPKETATRSPKVIESKARAPVQPAAAAKIADVAPSVRPAVESPRSQFSAASTARQQEGRNEPFLDVTEPRAVEAKKSQAASSVSTVAPDLPPVVMAPPRVFEFPRQEKIGESKPHEPLPAKAPTVRARPGDERKSDPAPVTPAEEVRVPQAKPAPVVVAKKPHEEIPDKTANDQLALARQKPRESALEKQPEVSPVTPVEIRPAGAKTAPVTAKPARQENTPKPTDEPVALLRNRPSETLPEKRPLARPAPKALEGFVIQLAFADKSSAQRWAETLERRGYAVSVTETGGAESVRVRIGNFAARDDAEKQLRSLRQEGLTGFVINLPQAYRPDVRSSVSEGTGRTIPATQ